MGLRGLVSVVLLGLIAAGSLAKTPKNVFYFRLPPNVRPESLQVRYLLTGKFGEFAGWRSFEHEGSVWILTDHQRSAAAALKAVVFSPGCEPERVAVEDLKSSSREHALQCRPAPVANLRGRFARPPEWKTLRIQVHVDYLAPWVNRFFGIAGDDAAVSMGVVSADSSGQFDFALPGFAAADSGDAAFTFVLREATSGNVLGVLRPPAALSSPLGMKTSAEYPSEVEFGLERNR